MKRITWSVVLALGISIVPMTPAGAATFTVTKTADTADGACDADCSLREAVIAANEADGPDTVVVPAGHYLLTRTGPQNEVGSLTGDLDIFSVSVTIVGAGMGKTVIDAGEMDGLRERVFQIGAFDTIEEPSATLRDLTVTGGWAVADPPDNEVTGGGIQVDVGSLTLERVEVHDNYAAQSGAGIQAEVNSLVTITDSKITENRTTFLGVGAGIAFSGANGSIERSLIQGNHAMDSGGGMFLSGLGTVGLENTTVSGNTTTNQGGGIYLGGSTLQLNNVSITNNTADQDGDNIGNGGGIHRDTGIGTLRNTIVAGNHDGSSGGPMFPDCSGTVASGGHNLIGRSDGCMFAATTGDQVGSSSSPIDPELMPLTENGGPTATHALIPGSPAVDAGGPTCEATDQRGLARAVCDIGAYELAFCAKAVVNRIGTPGKDVLQGTSGADGFLGFQGNDKLSGKGGKDGICGGPGKDTLRGGAGKDRLKGQQGKDTCVGGGGRDRGVCEKERGIP
jgi:CSLREA domain-containing protein